MHVCMYECIYMFWLDLNFQILIFLVRKYTVGAVPE